MVSIWFQQVQESVYKCFGEILRLSKGFEKVQVGCRRGVEILKRSLDGVKTGLRSYLRKV